MRLVAHEGLAVGLGCRDDEVLIEVFPLSWARCAAVAWARTFSQVVSPEVRPPTTDPASAESAEIYAMSMHRSWTLALSASIGKGKCGSSGQHLDTQIARAARKRELSAAFEAPIRATAAGRLNEDYAMKPISISAAMESRALFEPYFRGPSWSVWKACLKAALAEPMSDAELMDFTSVAGRQPPDKRVRELIVAAGRGAGQGFSSPAYS